MDRTDADVHEIRVYVTDAGHVHEHCLSCGTDWHLWSGDDPWDSLDHCPDEQ